MLSTAGWLEPLNLCIAAVGALLLGLAGLLVPAVARSRVGLVVTTVGLLALGLVGGLLGLDTFLWQPPLDLAGLLGLIGLLRCSWPERLTGRSLRVLSIPFVQAGLLVLIGGGGLAWQAARLDDVLQGDAVPGQLALELEQHIELYPVAEPRVGTDAGHAVPLFTAGSDRESSLLDGQTDLFQQLKLNRHAIELTSPTLEHNCHGWVFTGGRYWVRGSAVAQILADNGYGEVSRPRLDDLVVYRNVKGEIIHTGVVRAVLPDGTVLVESKWGQMGRFLHRPEEHCYRGSTFSFYHSERGSHQLRGLDQEHDLRLPGVVGPRKAT
jgi:hypothetical protein